MDDQIAIRVEHLSKVYKLYDRNRDRLKEALHLGKNIHFREHYALNDVSMEVHALASSVQTAPESPRS